MVPNQFGPWVEFAWDWREADKDRSLLLKGEALREAARWLEDHPQDAGELVREFIEASQEKATAEKLREKVRMREYLLARVIRLAIGFAVVSAIEFGLIVFLFAR